MNLDTHIYIYYIQECTAELMLPNVFSDVTKSLKINILFYIGDIIGILLYIIRKSQCIFIFFHSKYNRITYNTFI